MDHLLDGLVDAIAAGIADKLLRRLNTQATAVRPRLLDVRGAARYLSRSEGSVRHLIDIGKIPVVHLDGRVFVDIQDLDKIIEQAKKTKKAGAA